LKRSPRGAAPRTDALPRVPTPERAPFAQIAAAIADPGYTVCPGFLEPDLALALAAEVQTRRAAGAFHRAGIGRGADHRLQRDVRSDWVHWIDDAGPAPLAATMARLDGLRRHLNESLFAGLADLEAHLAIYPRGAFYAPHLDRFSHGAQARRPGPEGPERRISVVLYLNAGWGRRDGGSLRLWTRPAPEGPAPGRDEPCIEVPPQAGTLVAFRSADFWHEVRRARRTRLSLTGWFRSRGDALPGT
jgi:SM-20-related protein